MFCMKMKALGILLLSACVALVSSQIYHHRFPGVELCQNKPADVVFVMDSSSSIWFKDFQRQLDFVSGLLDIFDMRHNVTRVGAVSFSNWALLHFHLNTYTNKEAVRGAIADIDQLNGDTDTAAALRYLREDSYSAENGAREDTPRVGIILTDGRSNEPNKTAIEAQRARRTNLHLFAIGVGELIRRDELVAIASPPSSRYMFMVDDWSVLDTIKELLAIEACGVPVEAPIKGPDTDIKSDQRANNELTRLPFPTAECETEPPCEPPACYAPACGDSPYADIVFAVSPTANVTATNTAIDFYMEIVRGLDQASLDDGRLQIAVTPKKCPMLPDFPLREGGDKDAILAHIDDLIATGEHSTLRHTLQHMRTVSFSGGASARARDTKRVGVIIVGEGDLADMADAREEAIKMRSLSRVELFVVGVGRMPRRELYQLGSDPSHRNQVYTVRNYEELILLADEIRKAMCPQ